MSAARRFGIKVSGDQRAAFGLDVDREGWPERRFTRFPPEIRQRGEHDPPLIYGYAAAFGKLSRKLGGFVEQVDSGAFNESKTAGFPDVVCRYNHSDDQLLGTTYARTLKLAIDETGLAYEVEPPQSRADVLEYVQRGDIRHSSFAFRVYPGRRRVGGQRVQLPDADPAERRPGRRRARPGPGVPGLHRRRPARSTARWSPWPAGCRPTWKRSGPA